MTTSIKIIKDVFEKKLFEEFIPRIASMLEMLTEEEVWIKPNGQSNSIGHLILHLCGNVTQWLFTTMGETSDHRQRQKEFDERGPISREILKEKITSLMDHADQILINLDLGQLTGTYRVQGYEENGIAILIHITEHFSYHVGQITYFVKARKNLDVGYYAGQDLNQTT